MLSENVHPRVVMDLLGDSRMRTTMDTYCHVMPAPAREAADRTGTVLLMEPASIGTRDDSGRSPGGRTAWSSGWS